VRVLRSAYSGELAAGFAYAGHGRSVRKNEERDRIKAIEAEEWHHRELVGAMLNKLGEGPSETREFIFRAIGRTLGPICSWSGWLAPMYGAGFLESHNIVEYEVAARLAEESGHPELVECLLEMAEVEWEHERYFRERVLSHPLARFIPIWKTPPPKPEIRKGQRRRAA
jgi:demethoxyubiquinone hydroxylase (CLK1/Coq7/Cat5 family)